MTKALFKTFICALRCGQRKRPNALRYWRRTPKARFILIPKKYRYDYRIKY